MKTSIVVFSFLVLYTSATFSGLDADVGSVAAPVNVAPDVNVLSKRTQSGLDADVGSVAAPVNVAPDVNVLSKRTQSGLDADVGSVAAPVNVAPDVAVLSKRAMKAKRSPHNKKRATKTKGSSGIVIDTPPSSPSPTESPVSWASNGTYSNTTMSYNTSRPTSSLSPTGIKGVSGSQGQFDRGWLLLFLGVALAVFVLL